MTSKRRMVFPEKWQNLQLRRTLIGLACLTFLVLTGVGLNSPASAHGSVSNPPSRAYVCRFQQPDNPACADAWARNPQALYDWNSILIGDVDGNHRARIPDGELCSAGNDKFAAFDATRADWPVTNLTPQANGKYGLVYEATAPHATLYYRIYLTSADYQPTQPLAWDELELVYDSGRLDSRPSYDFEVTLPDRSGHHVMYTVWQRSDSPEAFYACSDVALDSGDPEPPEPTTTTTEPTTTTTEETTTTTEPIGSAVINGSVGYALGEPAPGLVVDLFADTGDGSRGQWLGNSRTDESGQYQFEVEAGCHVVTFIGPDGARFLNGTSWHNAGACPAAGEEVAANATLAGTAEVSASIGGTVQRGQNGIEGVEIDVFATVADGSRGVWLGAVTTDAEGGYKVELQAGCYVLTFIAPEGASFTNKSQWYNHASCVEAGEASSDNNAQLS